MTDKPQIREWKDKENLESLAVGDVARFCDASDLIDGRFVGIYDGRSGRKFIIYSRGLKRGSKDVITWKLNGQGYVADRIFFFDGGSQDPFHVLPAQKGGENYQALNEALERKGL